MTITFHMVRDAVLLAGGTCSTLHTFLPPWDWDAPFLSDFPRAQKLVTGFVRNRWYKLFIYIVGYGAVNFRSTIWKSSIGMQAQFDKMQAANGKV